MPQAAAQQIEASPYKTIWTLSWPQVLMMFFHFLIGMTDVWVAGRINTQVQASLGLITQSLFFLLIVSTAVANGAVAAISQSMGAGLKARANRYIGLCLQLALGFGIIFVAAGLPFRHLLVAALQVPDQIAPITEYFFMVYLLLLPFYYVLLITNAVFRARREVMIPLYTMILVTAMNTVLDIGLGLGMWGFPDLGFKGLAWATFGSVAAGATFNVFMLAKRECLRLKSFAPWRWVRAALPYLFKVAWPSGLMQIVWHSGYLVLYAITGSLPVNNVNALAGMTVGIRIESILFLPAFAFNMTASILIGHYLGARQPGEARKFGLRILGIGLLSISLLTLLVWGILDWWVGALTKDAAVIPQAMSYLKWNLLAIPFTLTSMIMAGALGGAGATMWNMFIMGGATWLLRLPLAYLLGILLFKDAEGIWIAMFCSQVVQSSILLYVFAFKDWTKFAMIKQRNGNGPATNTNKERLHA